MPIDNDNYLAIIHFQLVSNGVPTYEDIKRPLKSFALNIGVYGAEDRSQVVSGTYTPESVAKDIDTVICIIKNLHEYERYNAAQDIAASIGNSKLHEALGHHGLLQEPEYRIVKKENPQEQPSTALTGGMAHIIEAYNAEEDRSELSKGLETIIIDFIESQAGKEKFDAAVEIGQKIKFAAHSKYSDSDIDGRSDGRCSVQWMCFKAALESVPGLKKSDQWQAYKNLAKITGSIHDPMAYEHWDNAFDSISQTAEREARSVLHLAPSLEDKIPVYAEENRTKNIRGLIERVPEEDKTSALISAWLQIGEHGPEAAREELGNMLFEEAARLSPLSPDEFIAAHS